MSNRVRSILATWVVPLWPVTIVGAAVGAIAGTVALTPAVTYSASSVIAVEVPIPTNQLVTGAQPFADSLPDYLGGELTYLNSGGFLDNVASKLNQPNPPAVSATRSGKSDQFTLTASADSADSARRVIDTTVAAYIDHVRQDNTNRYKSALAAIDVVTPRIEENLERAGIAGPTPELVALYTQRAALQVQLEREPGVIVVQPTTADGAKTGLPLGTIGGGALGGLLALGAALIWRSRSGTITAPEQVGDALAPCPVVPLGKRDVDKTVARSIYAVLPPPRTGRIVVVGVSTESGTQTVADYISFAAAEHGPVQEHDLAGDVAEPLPDSSDGTVIVDAGPWAGSPSVTDAVDHASQVLVVARLRFDNRQAVAELCQALSQLSVPFRVVCVKGR